MARRGRAAAAHHHTWNAAPNAHRIKVNEALGYQVVATAIGFQRHL